MAKTISASVQGGSALARHLMEIEKRLGRGASLRVGFLEGATYPASAANKVAARKRVGKQTQGQFQNEFGSSRPGLPVATVAFWNEYGTARSPARPFFRAMVERKSPRWGVTLGNVLRKTDYDAEKAMALMGEEIRGQLRESIKNWSSPPNAAQTVERKGFNKPLIDTAVMLRSADYQVLDGQDGE